MSAHLLCRLGLLSLGLLSVMACGPSPGPGPELPPSIDTAGTPPNRGALPPASKTTQWQLQEVSTWKMPNGLSVWHLPQNQTPLISIRLVIPGGASADPPAKAGLGGLMLDMLDEGAAGRSALQLNEELQRLATDYGAWAEKDALVMSMNMLADQLQPSLVLMRDVLLSPAFNKDEFDRRKRYRIAEVMAHEADPGAVRMRVLSRVLFGEGYGGLPAVGLPATLRTIELADVQAQYKALVKPSGATLVVVGDVTRAQLEPVLAAQFGKWQGKPNAKLAAVAPSSLPMGAIYMADFPGSTQSSIALARRVEGTQAKDFFAALLFNRTLGGAFSSRLNLNLREDKGYTYGARSSFWRYRQAGVFSLRAKVKRETTKASITEMYAELQGMQTTKPFARAEYQEAVEGLLLGYPGRFERLGSVAGQLSSQAVSGRQAGWLRGWPAQLEATPYEAALASSRAQTGKDAFAIIVAGDRAKIGASLAELRMPIYRCEADGSCRPAE